MLDFDLLIRLVCLKIPISLIFGPKMNPEVQFLVLLCAKYASILKQLFICLLIVSDPNFQFQHFKVERLGDQEGSAQGEAQGATAGRLLCLRALRAR